MSKSRVADAMASVVARVRPGRRIRTAGAGPVRVNLGSGLRVAPGWINVDGSIHSLASRWPESVQRRLYRSASTVQLVMSEDEYIATLASSRFVHHVLERPLPFEDGSVDFLYASHVLEHFYREVGAALLREAYRILRPGGVFRVGVPDLEYAVERYRQGDREGALDYFFQDRQAGTYRRHRFMYDCELLRAALTDAGFGNVVRRAYREGAVPDVGLLDSLPEETLYVEATKAA